MSKERGDGALKGPQGAGVGGIQKEGENKKERERRCREEKSER